MDSQIILVSIIILIALAFDFLNGFHDAANSIATIVATHFLSPTAAVFLPPDLVIARHRLRR